MLKIVLMLAVQLGTPFAYSGPNITSTSDTFAAVDNYVNYPLRNQMVIVIDYGTATTSGGNTSVFTHDPGKQIIWTMNWQTLTWTAINSSARLTGTISAADITALQTAQASGQIAIYNELESLAVQYGILGTGTTIFPWTAQPTPTNFK